MVLRFAGAVFTALGRSHGTLTFTSGDAPARSAVRMLESIGLADCWQPAGPAWVKIHDSGPAWAEVSINVELPCGTTLMGVAPHLAAVGIVVG
ncbi:MAG TPA: hypothetical protein VGQ83_27805 [Polyangia bacterium]|jgi:hypothetical protein